MVQRLVDLAEVPQRDAQVVVAADANSGRSSKRPAELLDGLGLPPQCLAGPAEVAQRLGVVRPEPQGRPTATGGPFESPAPRYASARLAWNAGTFGRRATARPISSTRPGVITLLMVEHAEQVQQYGNESLK